MTVDFTAEQLDQLTQLAARSGTDAQHFVKDAALRLVEDDIRFRAAVQRGIDEADRGEFIDHADVVSRIEKRFQSR